MVLVFIDKLGVKYRWHRGGPEAAFCIFRNVMTEAMVAVEPRSIVMGDIEGDSGAIVCENLGVALIIVRKAFRSVFLAAQSPNDERIWLRGVIVRYSGNNLRHTRRLISEIDHIQVHEYSRSLMEAIAIEKAGFKGMRVIVAEGRGIGEKTRLKFGSLYHKDYNKHFAPFRRLSLPYPGRLKKGFTEYLWMSSETEEECKIFKKIMVRRLRWSARNQEKFAQAVATQVVFHECGAMVQFVKDSPHRKKIVGEIRTQS